ncbi:unnamed protein product [Brassica rapa subsp. narinosa]
MTLKEIFYKNELFIRWIHCWEPRNFQRANLFMGIELFFIDSKLISIQAFIPEHFLPRRIRY